MTMTLLKRVFPLNDSSYCILCVHLILSGLVLYLYYRYKRMTTMNYNWLIRILFCATIVLIGLNIGDPLISFINSTIHSGIDDNNNAIWQQFSNIIKNCGIGDFMINESYYKWFFISSVKDTQFYCCTKDLDKTFRLITTFWSFILLCLIILKTGREKKLTLYRSCAQVALRYNYNHQKLIDLCKKLKYAFFPVNSLETWIINLDHEATSKDIDYFLECIEKDEKIYNDNETQYNEAIVEARKHYESTIEKAMVDYDSTKNDSGVTERRRNDKWSYEEYAKTKMELTTDYSLL